MPKILLPIPEMIECVTRPIIFDVVRQLVEITDLPRNINIQYSGGAERAKQLGSAIDNDPNADTNVFASNDKLTIDVEERVSATRLLNEPVYGAGNLLIFEDCPLNIIMKPVYSETETTITVKYRAANESAAIYWRDSIEARLRQRRDINMHTLTYSYNIPEEMLYILRHLHEMRETVAKYDESYDVYFKKYRHPKITELTNLNGNASLWAVPETQMQVQGWFDFETPEPATREGDGDTWVSSFTYKFGYHRPIEIAMVYPLVVHNQIVPQRLRPSPLQTEDDVVKSYSLSTRVLAHFRQADKVAEYVNRIGYSIPSFDEFMPSSVPIDTLRILTVLFTVDDQFSTFFLSLKDLGTKKFTPEVIAYLASEAPNLTRPYCSAFMVNFYRNEFLINPTPLTINSNLDVHATTEIDLRLQHHIRISLVQDFRMLQGGAVERLRQHGKAAIQIFKALDPTLEERGYLPALIGDNYISKAGMSLAIDNIRPRTGNGGHSLLVGQTVQTLFVQTDRLQ